MDILLILENQLVIMQALQNLIGRNPPLEEQIKATKSRIDSWLGVKQ